MGQKDDEQPLWKPTETVKQNANLTRYMLWLEGAHNLKFDSYDQLWRWSVQDLEAFWLSIWEYFSIIASEPPASILSGSSMPGVTWFKGARLNYAENFLARHHDDVWPAMIYVDEVAAPAEIGWGEIGEQVSAVASALRSYGVTKGDRVVAYLPHIPETIIALLAAASIGAVWSSCSPDFGSRSVLDRFQQIEPKILCTVDAYQYGGKLFDRREAVDELRAGLPSLEKTIIIAGHTDDTSTDPGVVLWEQLLTENREHGELVFEQLPFDHPLWVLFSSGTTGLPKPIVQGHGGILLEHFKMASLHLDLKENDRFFWYTSTGWMMWNFLVAGLLVGSTIVVYNGSPGYPGMDTLWKMAEETGITYFGTSAAFISACMKTGIRPNQLGDMSKIRAVGSTGSPLSIEGFHWIYDNVNRELALESVSGGTDLCTAFVGGCRLKPIFAGEIQGAALGAKVQAFDSSGQPVVGEVGELVITEPMPSMPLYFWNDQDNRRYLDSYFDQYPGIWRHGDWIEFTKRAGCIIYGRSDSTINRQGIRMGTSEIYRVVESMPEIQDSLVVDLELLGRVSFMPLFVVLSEGVELDEELRSRIVAKIRHEVSPRHVPDAVYALEEVPYTLSGKKMEVPVRKILLGHPVETAATPGAMRNPEAIRYFVDLSAKLNSPA